jgi:hypothetical protein
VTQRVPEPARQTVKALIMAILGGFDQVTTQVYNLTNPTNANLASMEDIGGRAEAILQMVEEEIMDD